MKFNEIINSGKPVLVDFFAEWCGPCKAMAPILSGVKQVFGQQADIIKIDVDKNQTLAAQLQIQGVPTLILYKDGKQIWRQSGVVPKQELVKLIEGSLLQT